MLTRQAVRSRLRRLFSITFFLLITQGILINWASFCYATDITSNLVLWWKFDEGSGTSIADSSGNSNTGTLFNTPTWTTGRINGAVSFDGATQYVKADDRNSLDLTTAATVAFWFKRSASGVQTAFGKWETNGQYAYILQVHTDGHIYWNTSSNGSNDTYFTSTGTITDTNWHHLVGVYDAATLTVYLDGSSVAGSTTGSVAPSLYVSTSVVESRYNGGNNFSGILDEARIYARALSAADVAALYAPGTLARLSLFALKNRYFYIFLNSFSLMSVSKSFQNSLW